MNWKLIIAKIWMGIVYTFLGASLLGLIGLLVWGCITDPTVGSQVALFFGFIAVAIIIWLIGRITRWANDLTEAENSKESNSENVEYPQTVDLPVNDTNKMDYSDFVTIKIMKVAYMGKPSHWEVEVDEDGLGGTAPTFNGVVDIAMSIIQGEYGEEDWHKFDANERNKK